MADPVSPPPPVGSGPARVRGPGHRRPIRRNGWRGTARHVLNRVRQHPTGRVVFRAAVAIVGALIIVVGMILLPLPGPGWLIIFFGLAIWSIEFHWARRLLRFARTQVARWTHWYAHQGWPVRILVGAGTVLLVAAIIVAALWLTAGPRLWHVLTTH